MKKNVGTKGSIELAGSSKMAPRILVISIAMGADYLFESNSIDPNVPTFFSHNK